ncbi:DUF2339 domain-containing protein [Hugenholtzia roseola]|uniref:DUF2339 domain-containing protein n=1 Tax=Hugenholtzia roseola TaxID=1002 RepID=UPI000409ABAC|nr:DUF2339 domain-containing protein [Hugenholtzia roseola]
MEKNKPPKKDAPNAPKPEGTPRVSLDKIEENVAFSAPLSKAEQEEEELLRSLDEFKRMVTEHKEETIDEPIEYAEAKNDRTYLLLLENGEIPQKEEVKLIYENNIKNVYTGVRPQKKPLENLQTGDVLMRGRRVYLKVFADEEENPDKYQPDQTDIDLSDLEEQEQESLQKNLTKGIERKIGEIVEESKRDFEAFVAENLMSKIGMLLLIVGILLLINLGIERGYISNGGQLLIGLTLGGLMLWQGNRVRKQNTISSLLVLGGIAVCYYTSFKFFDDFDISNQIVAFLINFCITCLAFGIAVWHDKKNLGNMAVIMGFLTTYWVIKNTAMLEYEDGSSQLNYSVVFTYLLLLNVLGLAISYYKKWIHVSTISFLTSIVVFSWWLLFEANFILVQDINNAIVFATLYYLVFFLTNVVFSVKKGIPLSEMNYLVLITNSLFYTFSMYVVMNRTDNLPYFNWFLIFSGIFHAIYGSVLYLRKHEDQKLHYTTFGGAIFFISLAAVRLLAKEHWNTFFAIEAVLLMFLGIRLSLPLLKRAATIATVLLVVTLFMNWFSFYQKEYLMRFFFNGATFSTLFTLSALGLLIFFMSSQDDLEEMGFLPTASYLDLLSSFIIFILFLQGNIELLYHNVSNFGNNSFRWLLIGCFNLLFLLGLRLFGKTFHYKATTQNSSLLLVLMGVLYLLMGQMQAVALRNEHLEGVAAGLESSIFVNEYAFEQFFFHYLNLALTLFGLAWILYDLAHKENANPTQFTTLSYYTYLLAMVYATCELVHLGTIVLFERGDIVEELVDLIQTYSFVPFWAMLSFGYVIAGMRWKLREMRVFGMVLLILVLGKFFIVDFWRFELLGKIISLIVIGIVLLRISWIYNQLHSITVEGQLADLYKEPEKSLKDQIKMPKGGRISSERLPTVESFRKFWHKIKDETKPNDDSEGEKEQ